jgi:hypothetical protein
MEYHRQGDVKFTTEKHFTIDPDKNKREAVEIFGIAAYIAGSLGLAKALNGFRKRKQKEFSDQEVSKSKELLPFDLKDALQNFQKKGRLTPTQLRFVEKKLKDMDSSIINTNLLNIEGVEKKYALELLRIIEKIGALASIHFEANSNAAHMQVGVAGTKENNNVHKHTIIHSPIYTFPLGVNYPIFRTLNSLWLGGLIELLNSNRLRCG